LAYDLTGGFSKHITGQIIALDGGYLLGVAGKETKSKL
jgi:hypothetical protein